MGKVKPVECLLDTHELPLHLFLDLFFGGQVGDQHHLLLLVNEPIKDGGSPVDLSLVKAYVLGQRDLASLGKDKPG